MRYLCVCAYLGKCYFGFQKQNNQISIQEVIENTFSSYFNYPIKIYASGRTDRGVNAFGQTFHFDLDNKIKTTYDKFLYSINSLLPMDIKILSIKRVDDNFSSRYNAKRKIYEYHLYLSSKEPFLNDVVSLIKYPLDIKRMKKGIKLFVGEKDFKDFTSKENDENNFMRNIYSINLKIDKLDNKHLIITFNGNGFMRYMIRYIVGTLIELGRNKIDLDFIQYHLSSKSEREIVSFKSPACGLYLKKVIY
ncbi:MAG: tRNA pseudouridine(38-40) synthase TruA [Bacilli bacterium]